MRLRKSHGTHQRCGPTPGDSERIPTSTRPATPRPSTHCKKSADPLPSPAKCHLISLGPIPRSLLRLGCSRPRRGRSGVADPGYRVACFKMPRSLLRGPLLWGAQVAVPSMVTSRFFWAGGEAREDRRIGHILHSYIQKRAAFFWNFRRPSGCSRRTRAPPRSALGWRAGRGQERCEFPGSHSSAAVRFSTNSRREASSARSSGIRGRRV